jgi:hypothetical protein
MIGLENFISSRANEEDIVIKTNHKWNVHITSTEVIGLFQIYKATIQF